jgi:uncharacterized protein (TIGR02145 family)
MITKAKKRMDISIRIFFWIMLLACTQTAFSQVMVQGTVTNQGAEPVPNALVEFVNQADSTQKYSSYTNAHGQYSIQLILTGVESSPNQPPNDISLYQNHPNPFNPSTIIIYELQKPAIIRLEIYNVLGQKIKTLMNGFQNNLLGRVQWNATNDLGRGVPAGVYLYSLNADGIRITKKMLLLDGQSRSVLDHTFSLQKSTGKSARQNRVMSNPFLLQVSGENIIKHEQSNIFIHRDTVLNVKVLKIAKDIDGNIYRTVKIGKQWWMAENLRVTHYRNGDAIDYRSSNEPFYSTSGTFTDRYHDPDLISSYGMSYNWYAAVDSRNLAPAGWHVASVAEWRTMIEYLDGMQVSGGKLKEAGTEHWHDPNTGATNESGFSARGGDRINVMGNYNELRNNAYFWTPEKEIPTLSCNSTAIDIRDLLVHYGLSVRCVEDSTYPVASFTVAPLLGLMATDFQFDASSVSDAQDSNSLLQIRWDWDNDGVWDTPFSTNKTASYKFSSLGSKTIKLEVMDTNGLIESTTRQIFILSDSSEHPTVKDIDGNTYRVVRIGRQWWMAENYKVAHYRNGDAIPNVTESAWNDLHTDACCVYLDNNSYLAVYGRLYNWYAAIDKRGLAPDGWHIPSQAEWQELIDYLGGEQVAGGKLKETGLAHWHSPNTGATNESGFSALGSGYRGYSGYSAGLESSVRFMCLTERSERAIFWWSLPYDSPAIRTSPIAYTKQYGSAIRCCSN